MKSLFRNPRNFTSYAWIVLGYNLLVILWGAYVRATGSGAGCGSHWPLCNGEVIPRAAQIETIVEFTHRLTSGLAGILVIILLVWAFRLFPKGHVVRRGAALSMFFIITEGLVGAGLVLFELVAHNDSIARAVSMSVHLVNTLLLLASLTLTAWWAGGGRPLRLRGQGNTGWLLLVALLAMVVLGATGAVTALGDTLFPAGSLAEGVRQDFSPTAHFLVRLRVWHPIIAILTGIYLILATSAVHSERPTAETKRFARLVRLFFLIQLGAGALNVLLLAPVWMQLLHLLLADLVWIVVVLFSAAALADTAVVEEKAAVPAPAGD